MGKFKILIANIVIVVLAIVSIITLWAGSFLKLVVNIDLNGEVVSKFIKEGSKEDNTEEADDIALKIIMEELSSSEEGDSQSGEFNPEIDIEKLLSELNLKINLKFDLKSSDMIKSVGSGEKVVKSVIGQQVDSVISTLMAAVDDILDTAIVLVVDVAVDAAEKEIEKQIRDELDKTDVSKEEVMQKLEDDYDITEKDIEDFKEDIKESAKDILNGEPEKVSETIRNSEVLNKLIEIYAEQELLADKEEGYVATPEEIEAKKIELRDEIISKYEETVEEFSDANGEISKDTIIVGLVSQGDLKDEEGNPIEINNIDDASQYISDTITKAFGEDVIKIIAALFKVFGIFILIVIAAWAYVIVKIVVKFFMPSKTIGLFMPRFFGWMPHVFFVGIPMLLVKNVDKLIQALSEDAASGSQELSEILSMVNVNITSLTWVSALCSVLLLVVWIPYHVWRKEEKRGGRDNGYYRR